MTTPTAHTAHCYCSMNTAGRPTCCQCGQPAWFEEAAAPASVPREEWLMQKFRELESLYNTDRVASEHAIHIERIFDEVLHEAAPVAPASPSLPEEK